MLRIREIAEAKGMTIDDLHFATRLDKRTIRLLFDNGPDADTKFSTLQKIAKALGCKVADLISDEA